MFYHRLHRAAGWRIILASIFVAALAAGSYFLWATTQGQPLPQTNYLAADKGYGVTIDLTLYDDDAALEATLTALRENGLRWLRQPVRWAELEPAPGQIDWTALDRIVAAVVRHNAAAGDADPPLKLIAVLRSSPAWARPSHTPPTAPPRQLSDLGRFARALADRYGQQLDHYQIWHEPNLSAGWGNAFVEPEAYARLLREAALNIRAADPTALILTAGLAPTRENGPLNLNEMAFLSQLYQANAGAWFDVVAGQPYGFDFEPASPPNPNRLNFRRLELLRQVMLDNGDAETPIWATAAGWNALPVDWQGRPSPWRDDQTKTDPPALQAQRTAAGLAYARQNWPWLGPLLAVRWDSTGLAPDDPAIGFSLSETLLLEPFRAEATAPAIATVGRYPAGHPSGHVSPGWRTALNFADPPRAAPRTLAIDFDGTRLDLAVNRGAYRGYLWVAIDGGPANALPADGQGRSYIPLYNPLRQPKTVTLAQGLPPGRHRAVIEADGGWGQWPIAGWTVSNQASHPPAPAGLLLSMLMAAVISGAGLVWLDWPALCRLVRRVQRWQRFAPGEGLQVGLLFGLAFAFYVAPDGLALALLGPLVLAILYRPDLGLALIAFNLSFFQAPRPLPLGTVSLTETPLILAVLGVALRLAANQLLPHDANNTMAPGILRQAQDTLSPRPEPVEASRPEPVEASRPEPVEASRPEPVEGGSRLSSLANQPTGITALDGAALALLGLGLLSTLDSTHFGINMHAWRVLMLGPICFYFLVRLGLDYGSDAAAAPLRQLWRPVDALVGGAVLHAVVVLWGYFFLEQAVAAEGARRVLSPFYASPNNLALFLGRIWPIMLAVLVLGTGARRRWLYGLGLAPVGLALLLTYSRGALLVGLPVGMVTMAVLYGLRFQQRRWVLLTIAATVLLALVQLVGLLPRQNLLAIKPGSTGFFRLKLWQSSVSMLRDEWLLGVGPGDFLYQYRTRYILPAAWQEPNLSHPHNLLLDFATRLGLGGLLVLGWLQLVFWRRAWRWYRRWPSPLVLGLMGSMAVFLSHGLIDNAYFLVDLAFVFFLTMGLMGARDSSVV